MADCLVQGMESVRKLPKALGDCFQAKPRDFDLPWV